MQNACRINLAIEAYSNRKDDESMAMTLDEAIAHSKEASETNCGQCAEEHAQLAEWLIELKEYRKRDKTGN
jgi:hypothetical protein